MNLVTSEGKKSIPKTQSLKTEKVRQDINTPTIQLGLGFELM